MFSQWWKAALVAALCCSGSAQQVADAALGTEAAARYDAVERNHTPAAAPFGCACDLAAKCDTLESSLCVSATSLVKLGRVEIGESHLDPLVGFGGLSDTEAVAVADISDGAGKMDTGPGRKRCFAGIGAGGAGNAEQADRADDKKDNPTHAAFFNALLPPFFFRMARTNLSHFAMPARFSGM